jgi:hypothetical protein
MRSVRGRPVAPLNFADRRAQLDTLFPADTARLGEVKGRVAGIHGLSASVWTQDRAHGDEIARRLEVGAVNVNDMFTNVFTFPVPQSGWKESGVGARLGGAHGIRKYCRPQAVTATRLTPRSELLW